MPKEDYSNLEKMNDIKVVYKNGKEFVIEKDDTTNIKMVGDSLIVHQGIDTKYIGMNDVEKIRESRFDLGGTITLSIVTFTILLVSCSLQIIHSKHKIKFPDSSSSNKSFLITNS